MNLKHTFKFQGNNSLAILKEGQFLNGLMSIGDQCNVPQLASLKFIFHQAPICILVPRGTTYLFIIEVALKLSCSHQPITSNPYHWPTQSPRGLRSALFLQKHF